MSTVVSESPYDIPDAVIAAAASGNKIKAIKILRLETGLGLKEAKDVVDALDLPTNASAAHPPAMQEEGGAGGFYKLIAVIIALLILYSVFFVE